MNMLQVILRHWFYNSVSKPDSFYLEHKTGGVMGGLGLVGFGILLLSNYFPNRRPIRSLKIPWLESRVSPNK